MEEAVFVSLSLSYSICSETADALDGWSRFVDLKQSVIATRDQSRTRRIVRHAPHLIGVGVERRETATHADIPDLHTPIRSAAVGQQRWSVRFLLTTRVNDPGRSGKSGTIPGGELTTIRRAVHAENPRNVTGERRHGVVMRPIHSHQSIASSWSTSFSQQTRFCHASTCMEFPLTYRRHSRACRPTRRTACHRGSTRPSAQVLFDLDRAWDRCFL